MLLRLKVLRTEHETSTGSHRMDQAETITARLHWPLKRMLWPPPAPTGCILDDQAEVHLAVL